MCHQAYQDLKNPKKVKDYGNKTRMRNVSIKARFQPSNRYSRSNSRNSSRIMKVVEDTSIQRLDESRDDMESVGNQSMMDVSMMSAGSGM